MRQTVTKVAIGIIKRNNKYLACQRSAHKQLAHYWEFPGGKLEANETSVEALNRELYEELGVKVDNIRQGQNVVYNCDRGYFNLTFFYCTISAQAKIILNEENEGYGWFNEAELLELNFVPGTRSIMADLIPEK